MFQRFFEPDHQYVGFFKFPKDPEMVPGHLVIHKNIIEGQLYRVPIDIAIKADLPFGSGIDTSKIINAIGVFRLKEGKDIELSIFGIHVVSGSSSQLGFYKIYCKSMILNGQTSNLEEVFPEKLVLKISGLEEWYEKNTVEFSHEGEKFFLSAEKRIIEKVYSTEQIDVNLECYATFSFKCRYNSVKEIIELTVHFHESIEFSKAEKWIENLRKIFSLFFRKQLKIEEVSFIIPKVAKEFYYVHSDSRDFYHWKIKDKDEAIVRYSDANLFIEVIKNFLQAEPRLKKLMDSYFLMELNHSLYSENAFLTWVFELDSFIKKGNQKDISREEVMKGFSERLVSKITKKEDPLLEELFKKWYSISNEKAKFFGETLQIRLIRYFGHRRFFKEIISNHPEGFFEKVVKTRNFLAHPTLRPREKVIPPEQMYAYQSKLRLLVYCLILTELGMNEDLLIERLKSKSQGNLMPIN
ncbi:MAG: HEPN domain-containing protein [Cyclobacteriaceae bacterium]